MFHDLDATLRVLLGDLAAPLELRSADVSFDTPGGDYRPAQSTVNLFLHEVTENREFRDEARVVARTDAGYASRLPSLRVDCTYLTTAWSLHAAGFKAAEEHKLLGLALTWLSRFPVIDAAYLQGGLSDPPQPYPVFTVVARTKDGQGMGHFWSALGIPPRPSFSLTATIAVEPFDAIEPFPEVSTIRLEPTLLDDPVLTGRVLDHALAPVREATVSLSTEDDEVVGTGVSDERGVFSFPGIEFGWYRLVARATGHPDQERRVHYARDSQVHDVVLPGPEDSPDA